MEIQLQGVRRPDGACYTATIDDADFEHVRHFRWRAAFIAGTLYAVASKKCRQFLLHRVILNLPAYRHVAHRDGDKLNCRRENLVLLHAPQSPERAA